MKSLGGGTILLVIVDCPYKKQLIFENHFFWPFFRFFFSSFFQSNGISSTRKFGELKKSAKIYFESFGVFFLWFWANFCEKSRFLGFFWKNLLWPACYFAKKHQKWGSQKSPKIAKKWFFSKVSRLPATKWSPLGTLKMGHFAGNRLAGFFGFFKKVKKIFILSRQTHTFFFRKKRVFFRHPFFHCFLR